MNQKLTLEWATPTIVFNGYLWDFRIVDTRSKDEYEASHIHESESHPLEYVAGQTKRDMEYDGYHEQLDTVVIVPKNKACEDAFARILGNGKIPQHNEDAALPEALLLESLMFHSNGRLHTVRLLRGGFPSFQLEYDFLCTGSPRYTSKYRPFPQRLVDPVVNYLFIGSKSSAHDLSILRDLQITHVINVTPRSSPRCEQGDDVDTNPTWTLHYLHIPVHDSEDEAWRLKSYFANACEYISKAHRMDPKKTRILIHCERGQSRSATILIAYLISLGYNLTRAMEMVQNARPIVRPNPGFIRALQVFAEEQQNITPPTDSSMDVGVIK